MAMSQLDEIEQLLARCTVEQRRRIFQRLRAEFPIHALEAKLNTQAEIILEAIDRASDLTLRGIRGVIAEAAFATDVVARLEGWRDITPPGDAPYDFLLDDGHGPVRLQVKLQRQRQQQPMRSEDAPRRMGLPPGMFVVEVQRTRGGRDARTGEQTRPYRYGEFDILAVSLHPSTRDWNRFLYTVADSLRPRSDRQDWIEIYQPVPLHPTSGWTDDLVQCIGWFRSVSRGDLPQRHH
jgi:hypothetical protein